MQSVTLEAYAIAKERYADLGVDTETALASLASRSVSVHCWQGDDVAGFEAPDAALSGGGIQVTGSHPGRARTAEELRMDLEKALSLVPGCHRLNLHAIYGEFRRRAGGPRRDRDRAFPGLDRLGPASASWAWISTPPSSPIPARTRASR